MGEAIALIIAAIVAAAGTAISSGVNASEAEDARREQKEMYGDQMALEAQNTAYGHKVNAQTLAFSNKKLKAETDIAKAGLAETARVNNANISQSQLSRIEGFLNNNTGLQQLLLSRWGGK